MSAVRRHSLVPFITAFMLLSLPLILHEASSEEEGKVSKGMMKEAYVPDGPWDRNNWTRYRNLNDTYNEFDILLSKFPDILRKYNLSDMYRYPNGSPRYTVEGRTLWALKISDDPDINDTDEPEVFYCAMTHAREWISNEVMLYYINYVLHNYLVNDTVNEVVNNTQLWFVPVVNPDGFQESIDRDDFNSSYGIYGWRKNTNETNGSPGFQNYGSAVGDGVDPNRNFGYMWNGPGSSTNPDHPAYRGVKPFSEVETQIIRELALDRDFRLALSLHSYSGLNLYPWGHTTNPAPDKALLKTIAEKMSDHNGYQPIQGAQLYPVNGEFTDWMYGNLGIPSFTVEINDRDNRFIPELEKVPEDCRKNREVCFLLPSIADDPYEVFEAGIEGTLTDELGVSFPNASVNITGKGRTILLETNSTGGFNVSLEPGSYNIRCIAAGGFENETVITVPEGTYVDITFIMWDTLPPVIEDVQVLVGNTIVQDVEWRTTARIKVTELYNESNLTGWVDVQGPTSGRLELVREGLHYETLWNTSDYQSGSIYSLEAVLVDRYGNADDNGSVPDGPDRVIEVVDTTPPEVYRFQLKGDENQDGSFELGSDISVEVYVRGGASFEPDLEGNFTLEGETYQLKWAPGTDLLWGVIPADLLVLGDHLVSMNISDGFRNSVQLKLNFTVRDTTPPEFSLTTREDISDPVAAGDELTILLVPDTPEYGSNASVELFRDTEEGPVSLGNFTEPDWDERNGSYVWTWNTSSLQTGIYYFEGRLRDASGNLIDTGALPGRDLVITIVDLTPPLIDYVLVEGLKLDPGDHLTLIGDFEVLLQASVAEPDLTCYLIISRKGSPVMDPIELTPTGNASFNTRIDLLPYGFFFYEMEFQLYDRWGNADPDGYGSGPDILVNYTRGRIEQDIRGTVRGTDQIWTDGESGWVIRGEDVSIETFFTNLTSSDTVHLIVNGVRSDLTWTREVINSTTYLGVRFPTDVIEGAQAVWWRLDLPDLGIQETNALLFTVVDGRRQPVRDLELQGWLEEENETLKMNLSWTDPMHVSEIWIRVTYKDGPGSGEVVCNLSVEPGVREVLIEVERWNLTVEMISVHHLFPVSSERNVTLLLSGAGSSLDLSPPSLREDSPEIEVKDRNNTLFWLMITAAVMLLVAILVFFMVRSAKEEVLDWDME
ncbi:MAG: M14 family zinc carboxypeptidase [Thermoplasmatota archaeon]